MKRVLFLFMFLILFIAGCNQKISSSPVLVDLQEIDEAIEDYVKDTYEDDDFVSTVIEEEKEEPRYFCSYMTTGYETNSNKLQVDVYGGVLCHHTTEDSKYGKQVFVSPIMFTLDLRATLGYDVISHKIPTEEEPWEDFAPEKYLFDRGSLDSRLGHLVYEKANEFYDR
ncbi:hypothetical protein [Pontibacillus marinus]|uniref:Lipoprotein n=2 Tax=Pontibacillus TaxID=289201 RepID=A0A0A5FYP5_9BACI|nr:hypothetical protein [Pontibacillus marinus]KGX85936.1 hypothetical protein N783_13165 [Pontibacillus marinus BH030004 = DSM 16465]